MDRVLGTRFKWRKHGRIFAADGRFDWMQEYSQVPTSMLLVDRIRIFFTCRPRREIGGDYVSFTTFLDVDRSDPGRVLYVHDRPVLDLGEPGTFDQFGVMPCSVIEMGSEVWLYYVGWSRSRGVPWQSSIGLAMSRDGGLTFQRIGRGPIITRTPDEPFVHGSPFVLKSNEEFHLWYLCGTEWVRHGEKFESIYRLKHAISRDGVDWKREEGHCISTQSPLECQARPAVWRIGDLHHMLFSYRSGVDFRRPETGYAIGYAYSKDLRHWVREDAAGEIEKSSTGWDSEMVSYPSVLEVDGRILLFYCGNHMGRDGFGYATLEEGVAQ